MIGTRQILFIQGGGPGVHDEWDDKLCDSLRCELGDRHEVRYPRMPGEDDPRYAQWGPAIQQEVASLNDGATVAGHSVGGLMTLMLAQRHPEDVSRALVVDALPFYAMLFGPQATPASIEPQVAGAHGDDSWSRGLFLVEDQILVTDSGIEVLTAAFSPELYVIGGT